jgi:hypothetical protein
VKDKFQTLWRKRGLDVKNNNEKNVQVETHMLAYKLLCNCMKDEVPTAAIKTAERCV